MCRPKEEEPASLSTAHLYWSSQAAGNDKTAKMEQESTWATWATLSNLRKPSNLSYPEQDELPCSGCYCSREEWKVPIRWSHEPDKEVHGCKTTTNNRKYLGRKVVLTFDVALTQVPAFTSSQKTQNLWSFRFKLFMSQSEGATTGNTFNCWFWDFRCSGK